MVEGDLQLRNGILRLERSEASRRVAAYDGVVVRKGPSERPGCDVSLGSRQSLDGGAAHRGMTMRRVLRERGGPRFGFEITECLDRGLRQRQWQPAQECLTDRWGRAGGART